MSKLVSVIVTSYNHAEFLPQRMQSLLEQTYENIEIIVVDDCSTDNSAQVLEQYKNERHVKLEYLSENRGYANACNHGVNLSKGEYIIFAECDDYNESDHIELLVDILNENEKVGVAFCKSNIVDETGEFQEDDFQFREKKFQLLHSKNSLIKKCIIPSAEALLSRMVKKKKKDLYHTIFHLRKNYWLYVTIII